MAIDQNMKEVLKFNRSYMAKTHYSKSDLEQIARIYQMCKRSHTEPEMRDLYNTRFAMIVEEASKMIKAFSSERMSVDADALNLMQDFIEEFGRIRQRRKGVALRIYAGSHPRQTGNSEKSA